LDYQALCTAVSQTTENTFTADELATFTRLSEQAIYNTCNLANLKKTATGSVTAGSPYLSAPTDLLSLHHLAVIDVDGTYNFLLPKDVSYIREAYPKVSSTGVPKVYALFGPRTNDPNELTIILGPTPDAAYTAEIQYFFYPESIVTAGTSWLGDNFESALLNGCLVEAARFMKAEQDIIQLYQGMFTQSIALLKNLSDGKQKTDVYRDGQTRVNVS